MRDLRRKQVEQVFRYDLVYPIHLNTSFHVETQLEQKNRKPIALHVAAHGRRDMEDWRTLEELTISRAGIPRGLAMTQVVEATW